MFTRNCNSNTARSRARAQFIRATLLLAATRFAIALLATSGFDAASSSGAGSVHASDDARSFATGVGRVLSAKCVSCHHATNSKGGLDLSSRASALRGGDGGTALVPGEPDESPIYLRTIAQGGKRPEMPAKGEPLTAAEATALRTWIADGAAWPEKLVLREQSKADASFWSLQPVARVAPPDVAASAGPWSSNPIDRFLFAKMSERGLTPNREADPRTFIRRATFDLHGLPPTREEVRQFERECQDDRNAAVERLVERLLRSPRYGERWGRHWLDIAHYADTHGFERDQIRPNAWRYRDYVISALNDDLPYDTFLKQQIAGDVIAPDDSKSVIATGFLAAGPWDFVGQVETRSDILRRAARASDLDDIVTQVMTATMGLTINCARCHDHKLDPISQEEYYRLTAVFAGVKRGERDASRAEVQQLVDRKRDLTAQLAKSRAELAQLSGGGWSLADIVGGGDGSGTGVKDRGIDLRDGRPIVEKLGYHRELTANRLQKVAPPDGTSFQPFVKSVFVPDGRGTVLIDDDLPIKGVPSTSVHFWDAIRNGPLNSQVSTRLAEIDFAAAGHSILGLHANGGITFDLTRLHAPSAKPISGFKFTAQLGFGAGPGGAGTLADFSVYVDQELKFQKLKLKKDETFSLDIPVPLGAKTLTLIATDGGDGIGHDLLFLGDARLIPQRPESQLTDTEKQRIDELQRAVTQLEKSLADLPTPAKVFAIVTESPPEVRVLQRGNPEAPQQTVSPGVPNCVNHSPLELSDTASSEGERRRKLADWIAHPDNPLTRRVIVNRLWHHHFGQGLVNTPSDFGYGGDRGSHPELLDWLAEELLRSQWSLKKLHKTIMLSAAYRQASAIVPEHARIDNGNRLLWRQNTRRLDAESLRDAVLFTTGKLNLEMGGPGYRDFNYTEAYAPIYQYVTPDKPELWRRSVYRFVVRTTPHQFMSTLDCPDPANLTPSRVTTTTALQALTLTNNEFMLRQAEYLTERVKSLSAGVANRGAGGGNEVDMNEKNCRIAFQLALQRDPADDELQAARQLVARQNLFVLCRALLNANEFLYVD